MIDGKSTVILGTAHSTNPSLFGKQCGVLLGSQCVLFQPEPLESHALLFSHLIGMTFAPSV